MERIFLSFLAIWGLISLLPASVSAQSADAIAIRVVPNPSQISALRWYQESKFSGSPQSIEIDGYRAIRDGGSVYVNVADVAGQCSNNATKKCASDAECPGGACTGIQIKTNIFIIAFNQGADKSTVDIFGQILNHWKFNNNVADSGYCYQQNIAIDLSNQDNCLSDQECNPGYFCSSRKAKLVRNIKRLEDLADINSILAQYKATHQNKCPSIKAGSFLSGKVLSVWPSWQNELGKELGASLPVDPVNQLSNCINPFSNKADLAKFDNKTCWDFTEKKFAGNLNVSPASLPYNVRGASQEIIEKIKNMASNTEKAVFLYNYFLGRQPESNGARDGWASYFSSHTVEETLYTASMHSGHEYLDKQADESQSYYYWTTGGSCGVCLDFESGLPVTGLNNCIEGSDGTSGAAAINNPPVINCSSVSIYNGSSVSLSLTASDQNNDPLSVAVSRYVGSSWSSWPTNRPAARKVGNGNFWEVYSSNIPLVSGSYDFEVSASDGKATSTATCTIKSANDVPLIKPINDLKISQGNSLSGFSISASENIAKRFPLQFRFTVTDSSLANVNTDGSTLNDVYKNVLPSSFSNSAVYTGGAYVYSVPAQTMTARAGLYNINVEVSDSAGYISSKSFKLEIYNDQPVLKTGINDPVLIASTSAIVSSEILSVTDDLAQFPQVATLISGSLPSGLFANPVTSGDVFKYIISGALNTANVFAATDILYNLSVRIADKFGVFKDFVYKIVVKNNYPAIDASNCQDIVKKRANSLIQCKVKATDPEGNVIKTFSISNSPGLTIVNNNDGTASISGTPSLAQAGSYQVKITATDEFGFVSPQVSWSLTIMTYCGDGSKQSPNLEGLGGPSNNGQENCDGTSGIAITPIDSSINKQYLCNSSCSFVDGYCGDGVLQDGTNGNPNHGEDCDPGITDSQVKCNNLSRAGIKDSDGSLLDCSSLNSNIIGQGGVNNLYSSMCNNSCSISSSISGCSSVVSSIGAGCYLDTNNNGLTDASECQKGVYMCQANSLVCRDIFDVPKYDYCCNGRVADIKSNSVGSFTIVRAVAADLTISGPSKTSAYGSTNMYYNCDNICAKKGKVCIGVGLNTFATDACISIVHDVGEPCGCANGINQFADDCKSLFSLSGYSTAVGLKGYNFAGYTGTCSRCVAGQTTKYYHVGETACYCQ